MNRFIFPRAAAGVLFCLFVSCMALQAQDSVKYNDRAKKGISEVNGAIIGDSVKGLVFKKTGVKEPLEIPAIDIISVFYNPSSGITSIDVKSALGNEVKAMLPSTKQEDKLKLLESGEKDINALIAKIGGDKRLKNYLSFRVAKIKAEIALDKPETAKDAIKSLANFRLDNPNSWMTFHAIKTQAELLERSGKTDEAVLAYASIARLPGVPTEARADADFLAIRLMVRAGQIANADAKIKELDAYISPNDSRKAQVGAFKLESDFLQKKLDNFDKAAREVFNSSDEPAVRGKALNLLGEYLLGKGNVEGAFWNFLKVDTLYNQDAGEHARALYNLSLLFDSVKKDPIRARQSREKLLDPAFDGNEFQKKVKTAVDLPK
ncbi:MAG: hypothetical protein EXR99_01830 [Gemmataceae bacterium]|nr:hypothetical protein [Gemmataceae bacterium]